MELLGYCVLVVGIVLLFLAIVLGFWALVAWLAVLTASGFGYTLDFWPTFGAVVLISILCGMLRSRVYTSSDN